MYDSSSHSTAKVYYCDSGYYLKVDAKGSLAAEASLGRIFYEKGLGVEVIAYLSEKKDYLVTRSATGWDATHMLERPKELCEALADALHRIHAPSIDGVPLSFRYQRYMESANGDITGGYYDESVLMERFRIRSREEAWDIMQAEKENLCPNTLIHEDACLLNVIFKNGRFETFIDFNMAGVGDRHIDLYWALWSLQYNLKTERYTDFFLDAYGRDRLHVDMLRVIAAFELFG